MAVIKCRLRLGGSVLAAAQELIILAQRLIPEGSDTVLELESGCINPSQKRPYGTVTVTRDTTFFSILKQFGLDSKYFKEMEIFDLADDTMPAMPTIEINQ